MVIVAVQTVLSITTAIVGVDTPPDTTGGVNVLVVVTTHNIRLHDAPPRYR